MEGIIPKVTWIFRWVKCSATGDLHNSNMDVTIWVWVNTYRYIFRGMNIHLPAILMFTRGTRFWHTAILPLYYYYNVTILLLQYIWFLRLDLGEQSNWLDVVWRSLNLLHGEILKTYTFFFWKGIQDSPWQGQGRFYTSWILGAPWVAQYFHFGTRFSIHGSINEVNQISAHRLYTRYTQSLYQ